MIIFRVRVRRRSPRVELGTSKFASQRNAHAGASQFFEFGRHVLGEINSFEHNRKVI